MRGPYPTLTQSSLSSEASRWLRLLGGTLMTGLRTGLLTALLGSTPVAMAQTDQTHYKLDIPRQELATALRSFARETGLQIARFSDGGDQAVSANPVVGSYTAEQALELMLSGSGFQFRFVNKRTIAIIKVPPPVTAIAAPADAPPPPPASEQPDKREGDKMKKPGILARLVASFFACSSFGVSREACAQEPGQEEAAPFEEVVVTAQRFESPLMKTPVAVTAISGDVLRSSGVTDPTRLGEEVPNLSIDRTNGGLQISIRGVTSTDTTEKGDPSAAFLLDGIYIARPQVQEVSFFDIARVEVLRGPQGTLYGRNTTAGVVNVITNRPIHEFESALHAGIGNFGTQQVDAMINVPLSEVWALRVAGSYDSRDSYQRPNPGDPFSLDPFKKNTSGRIQALADFSENVNLLLKLDYADLQGVPSGGAVRATNLYNLTDPLNPVYVGGGSGSERTLNYTLADASDMSNKTWGVSAELNWNFGPLALTYLGSYRKFERDETSNVNLNGPNSFASLFTGDYQQNSHELRFATTAEGPFKAQFGAYYFKERSGIGFYLFDLVGPVFGFPQDPTIAESYAAFGQGTYSFTDQLRLTAGVRYSHDDKSRIGGTVFQQTLTFNPATDARSLNSAAATFEKTTWRVGLDYDLNDRSLLYGVVSTGYKAGGFNDGCEEGTVTNGQLCNQARPLAQLYYAPETLTAYELGLKTRIADDRMQLSVAAFHYDYENLQLSTVADFGGGPAQTTTNAAESSVDGIEIEANLALSARHRFDLAATYLDATYDEYFPRGVGTPPDYAGRDLDRSPNTTLSGAYTYTHPLGNGARLSASVRERWSDSYVVTAFATPAQFTQPSYNKTDVTLTYTAAEERWYVQAFGKNLEDEILVTGVDSFANVTPSDPRTYGVRAGVRF